MATDIFLPNLHIFLNRFHLLLNFRKIQMGIYIQCHRHIGMPHDILQSQSLVICQLNRGFSASIPTGFTLYSVRRLPMQTASVSFCPQPATPDSNRHKNRSRSFMCILFFIVCIPFLLYHSYCRYIWIIPC